MKYNIADAKKIVNNNPNLQICPINSDDSSCPYSFIVIDNVMYDAKNRQENENHWLGHQFIITKEQ